MVPVGRRSRPRLRLAVPAVATRLLVRLAPAFPLFHRFARGPTRDPFLAAVLLVVGATVASAQGYPGGGGEAGWAAWVATEPASSPTASGMSAGATWHLRRKERTDAGI